MTSIQYDFSTLSTCVSQGDVGSALGCNYNDGSFITAEEAETSEEVSSSADHSTTPIVLNPIDRCRLVYVTFGLLGVAVLLPFNFFITAHDYWMYKLRDTRNESYIQPKQITDLQASFTSYLTLASTGPFVMFLILSSIYSTRFPQLIRVVGSLVVMIVVFVVMTSLVDVDTDAWQLPFFSITMFFAVAMGTFSAILQAAVTGIVSMLPPKYMHILVLGQAAAGIVAAVAEIGSLLGHPHPLQSAFIYFTFGNVFLVTTLSAYLLIQKSNFFQFYLVASKGQTLMKDVSGAAIRVNISLVSVTKQILPYGLAVLMNFWVTLSIFPGLAVLVQSINVRNGSLWTNRLFLPLTCFLVYNVTDFCGRIVGGWIKIPPRWGYRLLFVCCLRVIFIPLFLLCNAHPRYHLLTVVFASDIYFVAFMTCLGFSNGIFVTVSFICGTKCLTAELQETAGLLLSAFLGVGLCLGSLSSYLLILIL